MRPDYRLAGRLRARMPARSLLDMIFSGRLSSDCHKANEARTKYGQEAISQASQTLKDKAPPFSLELRSQGIRPIENRM